MISPDTSPSGPYSTLNPAPSSALHLLSDVKKPEALQLNELLIRVRASTVVRDALTWPETYIEGSKILGHDFAGTVVSVHDEHNDTPFRTGDEIYGMTEASRAGAWAEYMVVTTEEACLKPSRLSWVEAAAVPLSALTAYQALFIKGSLREPRFAGFKEGSILDQVSLSKDVEVLVTGASGCVGNYLVQLANVTGARVTAATKSNERNRDFLLALGADEVVEYDALTDSRRQFQTVVDTVGGKVLERCWSLVEGNANLISVDSASWDFVQEHRKSGVAQGKENINALFFIVEPSRKHLEVISAALDAGLIKPMMADVLPLEEVKTAYDMSSMPSSKRGKIVLTI